MKPKGLIVGKETPEFKKILELSADNDLLASIDQNKRKFFTYLKNKLTPIQEEKSEHKCQQFETVSVSQQASSNQGNFGQHSNDVQLQDVSLKMPTSIETNLENSNSKIEFKSEQLNQPIAQSSNTPITNIKKIENNENIPSRRKWDTSPEHLQQVSNKIENHQNKKTDKSIKTSSKHHLPPVIHTRKTLLKTVPQAQPHKLSSSHYYIPSEEAINFNSVYFPINKMATYDAKKQEWTVSRQQIQKPKDHNILTTEPHEFQSYYVPTQPRFITEAELKREEYLKRKIAQEEYRKQLEQQIMQQRPTRAIKPQTTLRFDGEIDFKTETKQNFKPFRIVKSPTEETILKDYQNLNGDYENIEKNNFQNVNQKLRNSNHQDFNETKQLKQINDSINFNKPVVIRPKSSLTTSGKFKEHLKDKPENNNPQRRHLNQIDQKKNSLISSAEIESVENKNKDYEEMKQSSQASEDILDENNNIYEPSNFNKNANYNNYFNPGLICNHCKYHCLNGVNISVGSETDSNQIELNPLVSTKGYTEKNIKAIKTNKQNTKNKQTNIQQTNLSRSKSTNFQAEEKSIPRMIVVGKQKPHKNMSHLKFEGENNFLTTNRLMYKDNSMQNLNNYYYDNNSINRGVFDENIRPLDNSLLNITGSRRGKVKNKYRDLFASSEDIFNQNKNEKSYDEKMNNLSVKYKSAMNLKQINNDNDFQNANDLENVRNKNYFYENEQLADEEQTDDEEEIEEKLINDEKIIFLPKHQYYNENTLNKTNFERKKEPTLNSCYGSQLKCPALDLTPDKYNYKYTTGGHKYFTKVNCLN